MDTQEQLKLYKKCLEKYGRLGGRVDADFNTWIIVCSSLQLALTHPDFPACSKAEVERFVRGIQAAVPKDVAELIEQGWRMDEDQGHAE